jgi:hypothetical protein
MVLTLLCLRNAIEPREHARGCVAAIQPPKRYLPHLNSSQRLCTQTMSTGNGKRPKKTSSDETHFLKEIGEGTRSLLSVYSTSAKEQVTEGRNENREAAKDFCTALSL